MRMHLTTLRVVLLNGYSIEFLVWRGSADGYEVSGKFFITSPVAIYFLAVIR